MLRTDAKAALATMLTTALLLSACPQEKPPVPPVLSTPAATAETLATPETVCNYVVMIDASSESSRAYTFQVEPASNGGLPTISQISYAKAEPGLVSFKDSPDDAAGSIAGLLTSADSVLAKLPDECEGKTPTVLMATAGMRLLAEQAGDSATTAIFDAVSQTIRDTGLDLRFAGTIGSRQEAVYTWLTANYALGRLSGDQETVGLLDLGAAATSIAFVPENGEGANTTLKLGGQSVPIYAYSYTGYGIDTALTYVADDTCFPKGLRTGTGRFDKCLKMLAPVVTPTSCAGTCGLATPGTEAKEGVLQPPLPKAMSFYATGHLQATHTLLGLDSDATTPAALTNAAGGAKGKTGICGTKWTRLQEANADAKPQHLESLCFSATWIAVLIDGLGFARNSAQITWTNQFDDSTAAPGLALGAALCSSTGCFSE